jgi:hypothetical protein
MAPVRVIEFNAVPGNFPDGRNDLSRPNGIVFVLEQDEFGET